MAGLLEIVEARGGREDLPKLAHELTFEVDALLPLVDAAQVLGLAEVEDADLQITADGRVFVAADISESKQIFARRARGRAPLVRAICNALEATNDGSLGEGLFLDLLRRGFSEEDARRQLKIAIDWGRYGELFDFDANTGQLPWAIPTDRTATEQRPGPHGNREQVDLPRCMVVGSTAQPFGINGPYLLPLQPLVRLRFPAPASMPGVVQPASRRSRSSPVSRRISGQARPARTAMTGGLVTWL
jgi:hypothetical protein